MDSLACPTCGATMVERKRRSDGAGFYGCSRYPACRGIRPPAPQPPPPPLVAASDAAAAAGGSASAEYERRLARHEAGLPARRRRARLVGVGLAALGLALWLWIPAYWATAALLGLFGLIIAFAPLAVVQTTASWDTGARGEAETAALLEPLTPLGAVVLHDRRIPGSGANIDHIVICPSGVFVVETKSYQGDVRARGDVLTRAGRRTRAVEEALREAEVVGQIVAPLAVTPLIVVHRARVGVRSVGGVRVLRPGELAKHILGLPAVLSASDILGLGARLDKALPPAARRL